MKRLTIITVLIISLTGSSAWALFESNGELAKSAIIPMDKAVHAALSAMPGKAVEVQLSKVDDRTMYEVEIIDMRDRTRMVYVDAQTMQVVVDR